MIDKVDDDSAALAPPEDTWDLDKRYLKTLAAKLIAEVIGTALLCFTVAVGVGQPTPLAAIAIGCTLMAGVYGTGHISGGHLNPAVTLAVFVRGKMTLFEFFAYWVAQFAAGFIGGGSAMVLHTPEDTWLNVGGIGYPTKASNVGDGSAFLAEAIITFALCHTVLHVATTTAQANNSYYGLAIGFTVLAGAIAVGGVSGGSFNPAVSMLAVMVGTHAPNGGESIWIVIVGPLVGGLLAGLTFRITHPDEMDGCRLFRVGPKEFTEARRAAAPCAIGTRARDSAGARCAAARPAHPAQKVERLQVERSRHAAGTSSSSSAPSCWRTRSPPPPRRATRRATSRRSQSARC